MDVSSLKRHAKQVSTEPSTVRVELILEKIITPSSLTPKHLRNYKLSFLDQLLTSKYHPVTLFYPNASTSTLSPASLSSTLQKSLAKVLSFYYPFAGKLVDNIYVDCNDTGALFREVRFKGSMSETLSKEFSIVQGILFPVNGLPWTEPSEDGTLTIAQLTHFDCGGIAVSMCLTHSIADGYTFCKFVNDWAELARNSTFLTNPPLLTGSSLLQPKDDPFTAHLYEMGNKRHLSVVRLRFNPANIKRLKAEVSSKSEVNDPTRFEVVAALINSCATMAAANKTSTSLSFDPFTIYIPMNLRKLINPPVPNLVGNFLSFILVDVSMEGDLELPKLVSKIRKEKMKHLEKYKGKNKDEVLAEIIEEERGFPVDANLRLSTSFCTYKLYDVDFGWGRPARATLGAIRSDNYFVLLDAPDQKDGVDVIAALDQSVALKFKNDQDLLEFAELDLSY